MSCAADVRIIAATNKDIRKEVREGRFRENLYFRINWFPVRTVPPRERLEDFKMLCEDIQSALTWKSPRIKLGPSAIRKLKEYRWLGNVRELEMVLNYAALYAEGPTIDGKLVEKAIEAVSLDTGIPAAGT